MAAPYRLAFDIAQRGFGPDLSTFISLAVVAIGALLVFAPGLSERLMFNGTRRPMGRILAWSYFLFAILMGVAFVGGSIVQYARLSEARHHHPPTVEGCLEAFHPMPASGHDTERVWIGGRCFAYSDYGPNQGFNRPMSHGGPIRPDSRLRITYSGGAILRLEVADHACPAAPDPGGTQACEAEP